MSAPGLHFRGETRRVALFSLVQFPGNAKKGDLPAIKASLQRFGQFQTVVVQASTSHVIAGNNTVQAAEELGWEEIDAYVIDVDDAEAKAINIAANRLPALGSWDLEALLSQYQDLDDLVGTGIDDDDIADLVASLEPDVSVLVVDDRGETASSPAQAAAEARQPSGDPDEVEDSYGAPTTERRGVLDAAAAALTPPRRLLMLDLPAEVHEWASDRLEELCEENDVQTDAEMILRLLAEATGTEAPALEEES